MTHNINQIGMFNGMRVISSPYATETVPVRKHKLTRSQLGHLIKHKFKGITYHDRIQKKWNKRFGMKQVPGCFIVDSSKIGFGYGSGEKVIMAHPVIVEKMNELPTGCGINKQAEGRLHRQGKSPVKTIKIESPYDPYGSAISSMLLNGRYGKFGDSPVATANVVFDGTLTFQKVAEAFDRLNKATNKAKYSAKSFRQGIINMDNQA